MSKPKTIVTNPELKQMLATLRFREDADLQQKALDHIANQAHFLSAVHPAKDSQPGEQKYDFPVLTTGKGNLFYPIFTDLDELSKWTEEKDSGSVVLDFDSYAEMVAQDSRVQGLVVDPYGANFILDRDMVNYLQVQKAFVGKLAIEQMFQHKEDAGPQLRTPEPYPTALVQAMADYMATNDSIRRAWLRLMENEDETSYLVIIDAEDTDTHGDFGEVSSAAMPHLQDMYLDLITLEDEFSRSAVEGVEPFYTKA